MKTPKPKCSSVQVYPVTDKNNTDRIGSQQLTHDPKYLEYSLLQTAFPEFSQSHPIAALYSPCELASGSS